MGLSKTKALLRSKVYFPHLDNKTEHYIQRCAACQVQSKPDAPPNLNITPTPEKVWDTVNIDYLGPLPNGLYVVVIIDQSSEFPIVEPMRNTSADLLIDFLQKTFATFGLQQIIVSDNGPPFQSYKINQFFQKLNIKHQRITPLWPQANSQAEAFMKPLMKTKRTAYFEKTDWKKQLQHFLFAYRNAPHCTTKVAPAILMFNRATNYLIPSIPQPINENIQQKVKERQDEAKLRRKQYHDKRQHAKQCSFKIVDKVLLKQIKRNNFRPGSRLSLTPSRI